MHAQARLYYTHLYNDIGVAASIERANVCVCVCVCARARVRGCSRACLCVRKRALDQGKRGTNQILSETGAENRGAKTILEIQYETQENKFSMMRGGGGWGGQVNKQIISREHAGYPNPNPRVFLLI